MKNSGWPRLTYEEALAKKRQYDEKRRNKPKSTAAKAWGKRSRKRRADLDALEAEFKLQVRKRDGNRCRWIEDSGKRCTYTDPHIDAHHINERSQRPDEKYNPENGACICPIHHDEMHHTVKGRERGRELGLLGGETYEAAKKRRRSELR